MKNFWAAMILNESIRTHDNYENYCYDISYGLLLFFNNSTFLFNLFATLFHNISNYEVAM